MRPEFRSYFQNIVDMMLIQKESIFKFIKLSLNNKKTKKNHKINKLNKTYRNK